MDQAKNKCYVFIDLTREQYEKREIHHKIIANYPSGIALATYLLKSILPAGTDPMSPDNVLVLASGMFTGMPYPGATRIAIATKSPLTGLWAGGTAGGQFAWALSQTGWDAVVIQGGASKLSYLLLDEGRVFFRSAKKMEGLSCSESQESLREMWGEQAAVLCIGPAGESRIRFATVEDGSPEANVRGGMGALFGAKNLKALVVRPYVPVKIEKSGEFLKAALPLIRTLTETETGQPFEMGTLHVLKTLNDVYALPSRNFQAAHFSEEWFGSVEGLDTQKRSCPGCPLACTDILLMKRDPERPEYPMEIPLNPEHMWALGPLLNLMDIDESLATLGQCKEYGMDPVCLGAVAAWMAECREKKIEPGIGMDLEPEFGDGSWLPGLPRKITEDHQVRGSLAHGVLGAAKQIGSAAEAFAMHFCGQGLSFTDPRRGFWPVSFLGPGVLIPPQDIDSSSEGYLGDDWIHTMIQSENDWALSESIGICKWVRMAQGNFYKNLRSFYRLTPKNRGSGKSVREWGGKCVNMIQSFNWREGWRPQNRRLPERFFEEELATPQGVYPALDAGRWQQALTHYLSLRGWTPEGEPGKTET
jgi:aldehyde:ferredoxin oxidoreductase